MRSGIAPDPYECECSLFPLMAEGVSRSGSVAAVKLVPGSSRNIVAIAAGITPKTTAAGKDLCQHNYIHQNSRKSTDKSMCKWNQNTAVINITITATMLMLRINEALLFSSLIPITLRTRPARGNTMRRTT